MRAALVVVLAIAATGCGRWGFDATDDGDGDDGVVVSPDGGGPDAPLAQGRWASVSSADGNTCAITIDGQLWCWGANYNSSLGIDQWSPEAPVAPPTQIGTASDWKSVVAVDDWECGIRGAGDVYCWGHNPYGVLGDGNLDNTLTTPTAIDAGHTYLQIASQGSSTCGIRTDHSLWCWGRNEHGKLGRGTVTTYELTVGQVGTNTDWTWVGLGLDHACGLRGDELFCWGGNSNGQLGDTTAGIDRQTPEAVATDHKWSAATVGQAHTCAISTDGITQCWGQNWDGRVGNNTVWDQHTPVTITVPALSAISAGLYHTCGLTTTGDTYCWGAADRGVMPGLDESTALEPAQVTTPPDVQQIAAGYYHTCVLDGAHHLFCGGMNEYGQVGTTPGNALTFQQADQRTDWQSIAASYGHACGTTTNGNAYCWGEGFDGQLGDGAHMAQQAPVLAGTGFSEFTMGYDTTVARRGNELWLWGYDVQGNQYYFAPQLMNDSIRDASQGATHGCWSDTDGTLHCTGDNKDGQLGGGTYDSEDTTIPGDWRKLYAGRDLSCGTLADGSVNPRLYCWGRGDLVGSVQTANQLAPVRTDLPDKPVLDVEFGNYFACALIQGDVHNEVWCWGYNDDGELGNGTYDDRQSPTPINSNLNFTDLDLGDFHACAVTDDHQMWCWGYAFEGQAGAIAWNHPSPEQIPGTTWSDVAAGINFTCALRTDGTRWCAGVNGNGELGNGHAWTTAFVPIP